MQLSKRPSQKEACSGESVNKHVVSHVAGLGNSFLQRQKGGLPKSAKNAATKNTAFFEQQRSFLRAQKTLALLYLSS